MKPGNVYCIPNAPRQNGDLWVKINKKMNVVVMNPAGSWWRDKSFTLEQFRAALKQGV